MSQEQDDNVFNHEIAKRSVARAALHLGVERMSEEALDVMGDVLLAYLERTGSVLSKMVESSGRTSAHANVLDAVRAIDVVTSPAVHQVHLQGQEKITPSGVAWKDLAAFTLGKDWLQPQQQQQQQQKQEIEPQTPGGKVGPSSKKNQQGWHAPHLDEIPPYPQASEKCANPHSLDRKEATSLYGVMPSPTTEEKVLEEMPDEVFTTEWGTVEAKKQKAAADHEDAPPAKRAKLQDGTAASVGEEPKEKAADKSSTEDERNLPANDQRPSYVPSFLPPFPTAGPGRAIAIKDHTAPLIVSSSATAKTTHPSSTNVRSSLVSMSTSIEPPNELSYWGTVPEGRRNYDVKAAEEKQDQQTVKPLDRPSINRAARIIEGSMDAAH